MTNFQSEAYLIGRRVCDESWEAKHAFSDLERYGTIVGFVGDRKRKAHIKWDRGTPYPSHIHLPSNPWVRVCDVEYMNEQRTADKGGRTE